MADPLSITASVVGILGFALHGSKRLLEFIDSLRGAPKDITTLSIDLKALYEVLAVLVGMQDELARNASLCDCLRTPLENCVDIFEEFTATLHTYTLTARDGTMKVRTWKNIAWAFKDKEIQLFRDTIVTYKASLDLAVGAMTLSSTTSIDERTKRMESNFNEEMRYIRANLQTLDIDRIELASNSGRRGSEWHGTDTGFALGRFLDYAGSLCDSPPSSLHGSPTISSADSGSDVNIALPIQDSKAYSCDSNEENPKAITKSNVPSWDAAERIQKYDPIRVLADFPQTYINEPSGVAPRNNSEHVEFWKAHIILLINDPRQQTHLMEFCNSLKKESLYILGHVIVTDDFSAGVEEAKLQQDAWRRYLSEFTSIEAFVQINMSPSITWGVRSLILSSGLGGMKPNIAVLGFYNMDELRASQTRMEIPDLSTSAVSPGRWSSGSKEKAVRESRSDAYARSSTDAIHMDAKMDVTGYLTILEDIALRHRLNIAVGKGFEKLETFRSNGSNSKKYIDLWPIQVSAELSADENSVLTTNLDTYVLILQLGCILHAVPSWKRDHTLRILAFVEYESEITEERARVKAILDKFKIEAEVLVLWLACGQLGAYETIIHGQPDTADTENAVNECLKNEEWWNDLQNFRANSHDMVSDQLGTDEPTVSSAELEASSRSQKMSVPSQLDDSGAQVNISGLVSSDSLRQKENDGGDTPTSSAQSLVLSFNDLPTRAQHLILNELLRQNSIDTAVLFTTLPIPREGTCQSEEESIRYLLDIELLCNGLPPTLLFLGNSLTVRVVKGKR